MQLRASEIVHGCSVPVGLLKACAHFRQRHTVQQMEVYVICHFTSNQEQQCVWVRLLLSIWYCLLSYKDVVGFLWLVCYFSLYVCLYGGSMCVHTSVLPLWTGCCRTPAAANEREGEKVEDYRLVILWNTHRFHILKSSSCSGAALFVSLTCEQVMMSCQCTYLPIIIYSHFCLTTINMLIFIAFAFEYWFDGMICMPQTFLSGLWPY